MGWTLHRLRALWDRRSAPEALAGFVAGVHDERDGAAQAFLTALWLLRGDDGPPPGLYRCVYPILPGHIEAADAALGAAVRGRARPPPAFLRYLRHLERCMPCRRLSVSEVVSKMSDEGSPPSLFLLPSQVYEALRNSDPSFKAFSLTVGCWDTNLMPASVQAVAYWVFAFIHAHRTPGKNSVSCALALSRIASNPTRGLGTVTGSAAAITALSGSSRSGEAKVSETLLNAITTSIDYFARNRAFTYNPRWSNITDVAGYMRVEGFVADAWMALDALVRSETDGDGLDISPSLDQFRDSPAVSDPRPTAHEATAHLVVELVAMEQIRLYCLKGEEFTDMHFWRFMRDLEDLEEAPKSIRSVRVGNGDATVGQLWRERVRGPDTLELHQPAHDRFPLWWVFLTKAGRREESLILYKYTAQRVLAVGWTTAFKKTTAPVENVFHRDNTSTKRCLNTTYRADESAAAKFENKFWTKTTHKNEAYRDIKLDTCFIEGGETATFAKLEGFFDANAQDSELPEAIRSVTRGSKHVSASLAFTRLLALFAVLGSVQPNFDMLQLIPR